jgi:glycosyltransferase involved in cell wall biosynthesis
MKPIKICHITSLHSNDDIRIFHKECISLVNYGYDVTLLSLSNYTGDLFYNKVKLITINFPYKNKFLRFYKLKTLLDKALELDSDIFHIHDPELLCLGLKLKRLKKIVIFDMHEDYPLNVYTKDYIPSIFKPLLSITIKLFERIILPNYDAIIVVTPQMRTRLINYHSNVYIITNYPLKYNEIVFDKPSYFKRERILCYAGTISSLRMHHKIISVLSKINLVFYYLAGNTNDYLKSLRNVKGWEKVKYLGKQKFKDIEKIYTVSRIGIVIENYHKVNYGNEGSLGITKLFEYMQYQLPIICSDFILHKEIINKYNCGICVNPNDDKQIENAINYLLNNPENAFTMGQNGFKAFNDLYNWKSQASILINLYQNLQ